MLERMSDVPPAAAEARHRSVDPLTERERTVLRYLASTLSTADIASELYLSVNTVKTHQRSLTASSAWPAGVTQSIGPGSSSCGDRHRHHAALIRQDRALIPGWSLRSMWLSLAAGLLDEGTCAQARQGGVGTDVELGQHHPGGLVDLRAPARRGVSSRSMSPAAEPVRMSSSLSVATSVALMASSRCSRLSSPGVRR